MLPELSVQPTGTPVDAISVDQAEAARLTGLSAKTLSRLADAGEPLGRIKVNRRVLFVVKQLREWAESRVAATR
ncbi:helix-turn-helix domain-containing protein [Gemmata sp.]|uniref:helix-turn-helix domain-containing protein n=1 Tax=Gemmata sp. TaxID=1914242 RepID=UPI003F71465A